MLMGNICGQDNVNFVMCVSVSFIVRGVTPAKEF